MHDRENEEELPKQKSAASQRNKSRGKTKKSKKSVEQRPYPRVLLEKAVSIARAIKEKNGGNPWPASEIAVVLEVSPKGVGFVYHLLSSKKFGLTGGVEVWRGGLGGAYLLPTLSSVGASLAPPCFRFHTPLIEPDVRICRIRLSEKTHAIAVAIACDAVCNF
jgi:hypothetical protein